MLAVNSESDRFVVTEQPIGLKMETESECESLKAGYYGGKQVSLEISVNMNEIFRENYWEGQKQNWFQVTMVTDLSINGKRLTQGGKYDFP